MGCVMNNQLIESSPDILSGIPVFKGTRVPIKTLIDYLEAGDRLDDFLDDFPTVKREVAHRVADLFEIAVLQLAKEMLLCKTHESAA